MLGHLADFLIDDGLLSVLCLFDEFGPLHFNCVDDVLNVRVDNMLCLFFRPNDRHLNGLFNEWNSRIFDGLLHNTLLNPVLRENLGDLCQFFQSLRDWSVNDLLHSPLLDSVSGDGVSAS